jgi:integrase
MKVKKLIKAFLEHTARQVANGDRSEKTLRFYESRFLALRNILGPCKWELLSPADLLDYLDFAGRKLSNTTRAHNVVALKTLQNFGVTTFGLPRIFEKLEKPRANRRERIPTPAEVELILANASAPFRLIYQALSQTGCRPGELCGLQIADIDWTEGDHGLITIKNHKTARKTGKPRLVPVGEKFGAMLRTAIGSRTDGPVFLTETGIHWRPDYLSAVHRALRDAAGVDKAIVLYSARHGAATRMLEAGVELKVVSELLGHSSVTMTERYTHPKIVNFGTFQDR